MTQIDQVPITFQAHESASEPFGLWKHNIMGMSPRGLKPFIASVTLPAGWQAASLLYEISDDGESWQLLSDLRGIISASARAGMVLSSTSEIWRGVQWMRLRSEPPQKADVSVVLGIGAYSVGV